MTVHGFVSLTRRGEGSRASTGAANEPASRPFSSAARSPLRRGDEPFRTWQRLGGDARPPGDLLSRVVETAPNAESIRSGRGRCDLHAHLVPHHQKKGEKSEGEILPLLLDGDGGALRFIEDASRWPTKEGPVTLPWVVQLANETLDPDSLELARIRRRGQDDVTSSSQNHARAGVSRTTLYNHFANREALLDALALASVMEVSLGTPTLSP